MSVRNSRRKDGCRIYQPASPVCAAASLTLLLAAAIGIAGAGANRCEAQSPRAAIQSVYNNADGAANRGDANGAAARFGDPALKDRAIKSLSELFHAVSSPNFTTRIIELDKPSGNDMEAVVIIRQHFQAVLNQHRVAALIASDAKFREFWTDNGGQWQTMRSRVLSIVKTRNGHVVKSW